MVERSKRIYEAIEKSGYSYPELSKKTGISKSSLQRYATGETKKIPIDCIEKIAQATGVDSRYLMGWEDKNTDIKDVVPYSPQSMIPVPVIGKVAAGYRCLAETDIECYELVNHETINDGYDYVYLKVVGDSMEPLILEGDMVLVRIQENVRSGDYAVVIVDDEDGVVKQIEVGNNYIQLISRNPYYPPRVFKGKEMSRIRIFGKVVESKRKFL